MLLLYFEKQQIIKEFRGRYELSEYGTASFCTIWKKCYLCFHFVLIDPCKVWKYCWKLVWSWTCQSSPVSWSIATITCWLMIKMQHYYPLIFYQIQTNFVLFYVIVEINDTILLLRMLICGILKLVLFSLFDI